MGALEIAVESVGRDTSYGQIIEAVEAASRAGPRAEACRPDGGYLVYAAAFAAV